MNWDFIYRGETKRLDDAARAAAGGSFVQLRGGCTHFEVAGPENGQPVVLVHGLSVPAFIWDPTFEALGAAGYRAIRFDLFGRGYSDRPHVQYNLDLFVKQLGDLLDALRVERIFLMGLSMGGAITAAFTGRHPDRVRKLVLIDPIGTERMPLSLLYKTALLPGISELILSLVGTEQMVKGLASDFYDPKEVERFQSRYRIQMQYRGFKRAMLSTLRNRTVDGFPRVYQRLGEVLVPVLLLWGRNDQTLPLPQSEPILRLVPRADLRVIDDCGHIPNVEKPEIVNPMLLSFLKENGQ